MKSNLFSKMVCVSLIGATFLLSGCVGEESKADTVNNTEVEKKVKEIEENIKKAINQKNTSKKDEKPLVYTSYDYIVSEVFKDVAKITPNGKQMILIFGTNTDPYSDRLKADIASSKILQAMIKEEFSSYYFKAHENLRHKQFHEGQLLDVDTKTMIMVYGIEATPTIIFTDENAKAVIVVPGYMPTKQFLVTMDFMKSGEWKGKDRKNGEVYQALKDFYIKNGIDVLKKG